MSKGDDGGGVLVPNPIVADDTERTVSNVALVDVISEGPILGLVNGGQSIYFNQEQWQDPSGAFNKMGIAVHFRHGFSEQEPLPYQYISQTFDVNQPVKSSSNHIHLINVDTYYNPNIINLGPSANPSYGLLISNNVYGIGVNGGYPFNSTGSLVVGTGPIKIGHPGTGKKETAVPTSQPGAGVVFNTQYNVWTSLLTNPGANVLGDGNTTRFATYYFDNRPGYGWQIGPLAQIEGGVVRTITNPDCRAVRVILKVDKLFQQSGNGDLQPAILRFIIQYKLASEGLWTTCRLLPYQNWYPYTPYVEIVLPMAQPKAPASWNWGSILGIFGPEFTVAATKCEVTLRVEPHSRFNVKWQKKTLDYQAASNHLPDPRAPDEGWSDLNPFDETAENFDPLYKSHQAGFNPSDSPQIMRLTLYVMVSVNAADTAFRIVDDFGNAVLSTNYLWAAPGPSYNTINGSYGSIGDGTQVLYAKTQSGLQLDYTVMLPKRNALENPRHLENVELRVIKLTEDDIFTDIDAQSIMTAQGIPLSGETYGTYYRALNFITYSSLTWAAYVELVESNVQYSDTAVCGFEFNAQFAGQSVPSRAYDVYGRIIRVPSNYNAFTHVYTGIWDGTFQLSWTDNPVWVFLDLLTHDRYGLGQWVKDSMIDFASLYQVAQYCDEKVTTDGDTTSCPRFTFNTQIISQEQAYNVLAMLSSVFRGMIYWAAGGIMITQDRPTDPTRVVTPANVIDGEFQYAGSALQARHSVVLVQWNDNTNFGKNRTDVWEDPELIDRYGYVTTEMKAWGCTRFSQAMRMARWLLDTEKHATEVVTYRAGFDHADARPGEVIAIADPMIAGVRMGGRLIQSTSLTELILDEEFDFSPTESYVITVYIPTWGKVSVTNGSTLVVGSETIFAGVYYTIPGGWNRVSFAGSTTIYNMYSLTDDNFTLSTPYTGPTAEGIDYTLWTILYVDGQPTDKFVLSSRIPIIDVPIINPGTKTKFITLLRGTPMLLKENASFIITSTNQKPKLYTIVANKELDPHTYEINALEYDPTKFARIES